MDVTVMTFLTEMHPLRNLSNKLVNVELCHLNPFYLLPIEQFNTYFRCHAVGRQSIFRSLKEDYMTGTKKMKMKTTLRKFWRNSEEARRNIWKEHSFKKHFYQKNQQRDQTGEGKIRKVRRGKRKSSSESINSRMLQG